jgi:hypothetical protein
MLESDDLPILPIGIAVGVAVILVVLIALGLVCGLLGFVINQSAPAAFIGQVLADFVS